MNHIISEARIKRKEKAKQKAAAERKKLQDRDAADKTSINSTKEYTETSLTQNFRKNVRATPAELKQLNEFLSTKKLSVFEKIYDGAMQGDAMLLKYLGDLVYSKDKLILSDEEARAVRSKSDIERIDFLLDKMMKGELAIATVSKAIGAFKAKAEFKQSLLDIEAIEDRLAVIETKFSSISKAAVETEIVIENTDA